MLLICGVFMDKVCYVFPGQGSQFIGMGKDLYDKYESARKIFDISNEILGFDITKLMFDGPEEDLGKTINCQPAMLLTSFAYFKVLTTENKKIPCSLTLGHSIGEYPALVASEALSLEDALKLVKIRAESMTECIPDETVKKGTSHMAAVLTGKLNPNNLINKYGKKCSAIELINEACEECSLYEGINKGIVGIANINSADQTVISGNNNALIRAVEYLKNRNIKKIIYLPVEGPFHSKLMRPAAEVMKEALDDKNITINKPKTPYITNGKFIFEPDKIKESLVEQICGTVKWKQSLEKAIKMATKKRVKIFIECGPGDVQTKLLKRNLLYKDITILNVKDYIN